MRNVFEALCNNHYGCKTEYPEPLTPCTNYLPQERALLAQGRAQLRYTSSPLDLLPLPPLAPLPRPICMDGFRGVGLEGVEVLFLFLFPPASRGVSAGFCGCFGEPAASALTSAGAAASPGQLTILRIAVSSSLKISAPSLNGGFLDAAHRLNNLLQVTMRRTLRVGRDWGPEQGQAHVHGRKII